MVIHPDGSIEGTPEELSKYLDSRKLQVDLGYDSKGVLKHSHTKAWENCGCNPKNGGSGICGCVLNGSIIT